MDEHEWETSTDYLALWHAMEWGDSMDRKRRLVATGVCRRLQPMLHDPIHSRVIDLSEKQADEAFSSEEWDHWDAMCEDARLAADGAAATVERAAGDVVYGLRHDDHKIGRALETAADVFGYQAAIAGGLLRADAKFDEARTVWTDPVFIAGRDGDGSRFIAEVIRDVAMKTGSVHTVRASSKFASARSKPPAIAAW